MTQVHPLAEWLQCQQISKSQFARKVGISAAHLHLVCQGKRGVSITVAVAIERETKGRVTVKKLSESPPTRRKSPAP